LIRLFVFSRFALPLALVGHPVAKPALTAQTGAMSRPRIERSTVPLPMLPGISRIRIETGQDRVLLVEEVSLPRGEWSSGGLDLYVAFGAPGPPIALDAQLLTVPAGASESSLTDRGEPVVVDFGTRRPSIARPLLGKVQMAGVILRVKEAQLRRAYDGGGAAALRVRTLLPPPPADSTGGRDVVVRLGIAGGLPLTLGHIQMVSLDAASPVARAEARLCGADADPWPLSVAILPRHAAGAPPGAPATIAPWAAVRHATDDLCIRWWNAQE
jgi:hypothetical protein